MVSPQPGLDQEKNPVTSETPQAQVQVLEAPKNPTPAPEPVEVPEVLKRIAWCESRNRQFEKDGSVVRGSNPDDIGKYQINLKHWGDDANKLGYDLFTEQGNELMALYIYHKKGTQPWHWSQKCWDK